MITQGWLQAGEVALEPIELYEDPHHRRGLRPDHDLSQPMVQERCLREVEEDKVNVEWLACPCTTFCDWNLQNNGTRTFSNPTGLPNDKEAMGNCLAEFEAKIFEKALEKGHFPIAESSGRSGRYPKMWNLPCQRILQRPDVDFLWRWICVPMVSHLWMPGSRTTSTSTAQVSPSHATQGFGRRCSGFARVSPRHTNMSPYKDAEPTPQSPDVLRLWFIRRTSWQRLWRPCRRW